MTATTDSATPLLQVNGVSKGFPGVQALDGVRLDLRHGEVHAVVGENGAGKSTLMKLLAGIDSPTRASSSSTARRYAIEGPRHAQELGISIIHQELNLMPDLTVAQNIFIGRERAQRRRLPRRPRAEPAHTGAARPARAGAGPDRAGRSPHRRPAADGRDREGAQLQRPGPHHGRADRGAERGRSRDAVRADPSVPSRPRRA